MTQTTEIGRLTFTTETEREYKLVKRLKSLRYYWHHGNDDKAELEQEIENIFYCMWLMGLVEVGLSVSDLIGNKYE